MAKASAPFRRSAARSGLVTALSLATVTGLAAAVGVLIARTFGRTAETDGFFAAYGLFIVLVLAASALRLVVLPPLARARVDGRLAAETAGFAVALSVLAVPALALSALGSEWLAAALTAREEARAAAEEALVWMVPAAVAHLYAGLASSALAALDDYGTAALGYALGSVAGFVLILLRADEEGIVAVAWGMALNGAIALALPLARLLDRARAGAVAGAPAIGARLAEFARGVAVPLTLQGVYVVCYRLATALEVGAPSSFSYAYLIASALVAVTASSLGLVSSAPLARRGLDAAAAARHVLGTAWLSLAVIGAATGAFALAGARLVDAALGDAYSGETGAELGRLVVALAPWMIASVGVSVTFPLLFVAGRSRALPLLAVAALALHVPLAWAARELLGLAGLALALALTTLAVLAGLLAALAPRALAAVARGLVVPAALCATLALVAFGAPALVLDGIAAAAAGLVLYAGLLALTRPRGLTDAWAYVRALH